RINSLQDRNVTEKGSGLDWKNWTSKERDGFERIADFSMQKFGYFDNPRTKWRPFDYFEKRMKQDFKYEETTIDTIEFLSNWMEQIDKTQNPLGSVANFGCTYSKSYKEIFKHKKYYGVDFNKNIIDWSATNMSGPN